MKIETEKTRQLKKESLKTSGFQQTKKQSIRFKCNNRRKRRTKTKEDRYCDNPMIKPNPRKKNFI